MEKRDFFISYTQQDELWALWIADTLTAHGYTVYIQARDIVPGDNFLDKMNEFLKNSVNFIAVWSQAYSKSGYCMAELQAAFYQRHNGQMTCLLPVRIDNYPMEPLYATLVHVDLSNMSVMSAKVLMTAVRHAIPCPQSALKSSSQNNAEIFYQRGNIYRHGLKGVKQNFIKARQFWEQAAEKGHADALNELGILDYYGSDYTKARKYWEQAAEKGSADALYNLGWLYEHGQGVTMGYSKALKYYQKAADGGSEKASEKLENFHKQLNS